MEIVYCAFAPGGSFPEDQFVTTEDGLRVHRVKNPHTARGNPVREKDGRWYLVGDILDVAEAAALDFSSDQLTLLAQPDQHAEHE